MTPFRFDGRVALITGVRPGIGGAIAACLAQAGAELVLANRTTEAAERVAGPLREQGAKVHVVPFSPDERSAQRTVQDALAAAGRIDILLHNAGGCTWTPLEAIDEPSRGGARLKSQELFLADSAALPALKQSAADASSSPRRSLGRALRWRARRIMRPRRRGSTASSGLPRSSSPPTGSRSMASSRGSWRRTGAALSMRRRASGSSATFRWAAPAAAGHRLRHAVPGERGSLLDHRQTLIVDGGATLPETGYAMEEQWVKGGST